MAGMSHAKIRINRAPGLTSWTAIVTEGLGFGWATAPTLGQAVADLSAPAKGKLGSPTRTERHIAAKLKERLEEARAAMAEPRRRPVSVIGRSAAAASGADVRVSLHNLPRAASSAPMSVLSLASSRAVSMPRTRLAVSGTRPRLSAHDRMPPSSSTTRAAVPGPPVTTALPRGRPLKTLAVLRRSRRPPPRSLPFGGGKSRTWVRVFTHGGTPDATVLPPKASPLPKGEGCLHQAGFAPLRAGTAPAG